MILRLALILAALAAVHLVPAQSRLTANTLALDAPENAPAATMADVAWLAGRWVGRGFGGEVEEAWSPPMGGTMIGTFRLVRDDVPNFYEFLVLAPAGESLAYQLKHFHPDLRGWEEKDDCVTFPLVRVTADELCFHGLTLRRERGGCTHYLAMKQKDGTHSEVTLRYARADQPAPTAAIDDPGAAATALAGLAPLLGSWGPAEAAHRVVHDYAWTVGGQAMRLREGYEVGKPESAELDGVIFHDPSSGTIRFVAVAGRADRQGRVFRGEYRVHDDGRIERTYEVSYRTLADVPGEEFGGMTRRYREIYTMTDDALAATLDWWRDGRWQPFAVGKYSLVRRGR